MKKIIICLLIIFIMMMSCACSQEERLYTEAQGDLQITYAYNGTLLVSKSVYDVSTGITTEYCYFYENTGWGAYIVGTSVVTIKGGQIIAGFEAHK